jgi:hypothetical protein
MDPDRQGEGIGIRLLTEADRRWRLNFDTQNYTRAGLALVTAYEHRHTRRSPTHRPQRRQRS